MLRDNRANAGGGMSAGSNASLTECVFLDNVGFSELGVTGRGGAISRSGPLTLTNCTLARNSAEVGGGFAYGSGTIPGVPTIYNTIIAFSTAGSGIQCDGNASALSERPGIRFTVEGHCDERGSAKYNLALGDRRAESAKQYLVGKGIDAQRIETISLGEERPFDPGHNEDAWAKNRRAPASILASIPGRLTFTTTGVPSGSTAR